jgi:micrococcal nuclease
VGALSLLPLLLGPAPAARAQAPTGPAYVTRVVDGDTLYAELGGHIEVVRYLGVSTPRIEHPAHGPERYARLAHEANRQLVEGRWIYLVFDGPPRDAHGRLLAYVWVGGQFVNALLVHRGYGEAATASPARHGPYFRSLEEGARRARRGVWRDPDAHEYHRPRASELDADAHDEQTVVPSGGRVFSAPAPFLPSATTSAAPPAAGPTAVPAAPAPAPRSGPAYVSPRGR